MKDFDQAFLNYQRANELTKSYSRKYSRHHQTLTVDAISRFYTHDWIRSQSRAGANVSARPIFIVGMPRSGTSLTEQILASHPAVCGAGELMFWTTAMQDPAVLKGEMNTGVLHRLSDTYIQLLEDFSAGKLRVVDKMPINFHWMGLIHVAIPNARIIHMQRDPIDTCLSIYFQNFDGTHSYANDLEDLAHYYRE